MLLKTIAHSWATSKLEREEGRTQSLIREIDREMEAAQERIQVTKGNYSRAIKSHKKKRENDLNAHIEAMSDLFSITHDYLPDLKKFQAHILTCLDSWMSLDLMHNEIIMVNKKIESINSMIELLKAYIAELYNLSQCNRRIKWRKFCNSRGEKFTSDFVENEKTKVENRPITGNKEFEAEIRRLNGHRSALIRQNKELYAERDKLFENKASEAKRHAANKENMREVFLSCDEHWDKIAVKLAFHVLKDAENKHVKRWISEVTEGGTLPRLKSEITTTAVWEHDSATDKTKLEYEKFRHHNEKFKNLHNNFEKYRLRVKNAHDLEEYSDTFYDDRDKKDELFNKKQDAYGPKQDAYRAYERQKDHQDKLSEARKIWIDLRDELDRSICQIRPLHPESVVDALFEILDAESMKRAFGNLTKE